MTTTRRALGGAMLVALLGGTFIASGAASHVRRAAPAPQDTTRVLSASLLRRLAEAADGYRTDEPVWVVASTEFPHNVVGVFADRAQALRRARDLGGPWGSFGPYVTPRDATPDMMIFYPHMRPTISDSTRWHAVPPWPVVEIDSVTILVHHHSGRTWRQATRAVETDAIFFTLSAVDKFVVPYYVRLEGPERVARWRASLGARR